MHLQHSIIVFYNAIIDKKLLTSMIPLFIYYISLYQSIELQDLNYEAFWFDIWRSIINDVDPDVNHGCTKYD